MVPIFRYISTMSELKRGKQTLAECSDGILNMAPDFGTKSNQFTLTVLNDSQSTIEP